MFFQRKRNNNMTNRKQLLKLFDVITTKAVTVMRGKNTDYATEKDSLANFRASEVLNIDPRKALLIRMMDKIKRQVNYIETGSLTVDSAEDDIIDIINYAVLLHALNLEEHPETTKEIKDWDLKQKQHDLFPLDNVTL